MPGRKKTPASTPREASPPRTRRSRTRTQSSSNEEEPVPPPRTTRNRRNVESSSTPESPPSSGPATRRTRARPVPPPQSQTQRSQRGTQSQTQKSRGGGTQKSQKKKKRNEDDDDYGFEGEGGTLPVDVLVKDVIYYAFMMQGKLHPIRKSELIKIAMNKQSRDFREVIDRVADELLDVFGAKLVGLMHDGSGDVQCEIWEATSFILVSKFTQQVTNRMADSCGNAYGAKGLSRDMVTATLMLILSTTYMMDRMIDEDTIWEMLEQMEIAFQVCKKKEELRRFLKTEFVDTLYLTKHEDKSTDQLIVRYGWGFRAEMEISKYSMLKHVAEKILRKNVTDFPFQLSKIPQGERRKIDALDERMRSNNENGVGADSDSDISCIGEVVENEDEGRKKSQTPSTQKHRRGRRVVVDSGSSTE